MEVIFNVIEKIGLSVILIFLLVLVTVYYTYTTWEYDYWKKQGIPGNSAWPILGTVRLSNMFRRLEIVDYELHKKFGRVHGGFEGRTPVLYVIEPDLIKQVMIKDFPTFTNRRDIVGDDDPVFSKMLTDMRGEEWKNTRTILSPTFTTGKLKQMMYLIEECVKVLLPSLDEKAEANEPVEVKSFFSTFTLDVISSCAFGMQTNSLKNPNNDFVKNARKAFTTPSLINFIILLFPKSFSLLEKPLQFFTGNPFAYFTDVANKMIDLRQKEKLQSRKDFLDLLIEAEQQENVESNATNEDVMSSPNKKKILTRNTMVANCMIFLLAGHETTATTLSYFAYCLANNPYIQDKLIKEIDDVMTECKGILTYEIVMKLQYLDMALSETLRMYPPIIRVDRDCSVDGYKLGDAILKKGSLPVISVYSLHHDEKLYPNPDVFDPERFSTENKAKRHPFAYIPFGVGPRNCIAMRFALTEVKLTMASILSQFRFNTCNKTEFPLQFTPAFGLMTPKSVTLQVQKREDRPHFEN